MPHDRRHAKLLLLIAIIGVPLLALAVFRGLRAVPRQPLSQRVSELENDPREHRADQPGEAIEWRLMRMRDENGQIPDGAMMRAMRQMDAMRAAQAKLPQPSAANTTISWTALGPSNIGGRVRSIAIHPTNANTIFAGSASGGIWKTTDGGVSWSPVNDFMANLAVTSIVFVPTNPTVMYAATGEGFAIGFDGIRGAGVFKSTDGGATWNQLGSTANPNFYYVNRVAVSPDGLTLLAATTTGIYRSTDGGATFPAATLGGSLGGGIGQVVFDPNDSSRAVAGAVLNALGSTPGWYSTDGGANWTPATGLPGLGRAELVYAKSVANKVYASAGPGNRYQIYVSTNGGQSFTLATSGTSPNFVGSLGNYTNAMWVDPTNDQHLVVGGVELYRSTNGGTTLAQITGVYFVGGAGFRSSHVDNHAIVSPPNYDGSTVKTVFVGNDGGVYKAVDITAATISSGWTDLNNGLTVTQFYSVATNVVTGSIVGGTQDNGSLRTSGSGTTWSLFDGGDGGFVAHDPVNTNYYYPSLAGARVMRNHNDGADLDTEDIVGYWCDSAGCPCKSGALGALCQDWKVGHANFLAPVVFDPNSPERLLVGADHLFVTSDPRTAVSFDSPTASGPSWATIKASTGQYISAVAVSPTSSNIIAVGHNDGAVYVTTNGTNASPTWTKVDDNATALPNRMVTSITFSAANPNTLWVTFGGYTSQNIWKSTNLGGGWSPINGSGMTALPSAPIYDLKFLATDENWLYLATEIGLFTSVDGGANWTIPQQGPASVSVDQLAWLGPNTLVAATHGRGMFKAAVGGSAPSITTQPMSQMIVSGQTATMNVVAEGTAPLSYQWYAGTTGTLTNPVPGATSSSLTTPALTTTTSYWVRVSNPFGAADSNTATIVVNSPGCTFGISPAAASLVVSGGPGSVKVTTQGGCSWIVAAVPAWVSTSSGGSGTGSDIWVFTVAANLGGMRSQVVSVAGQPFTLTQLGVKTMVAGTHSRFDLADDAAENWSSIEAVAGRSYCAQLTPAATAQSPGNPTLTALRADGTTTITAGGTSIRRCFIAPATETALFKVKQIDAQPRSYLLAVSETTLWANWFYIGGNNSSYTIVRNTTDAIVNTTITWRAANTGASVGTVSVAVPPGGVKYYDARTNVTGATAGSVEIGHDGEPQALVGSQTTLSATTGLSFDTIMMQRRQR